jgi:two-component system, chemotaxis family, chemotaxis protein CheY
MARKAPIIALVDDDKIFQLTASKTIKATAITDNILQFENGEQALAFLRKNLSDASALPDFIFLDINMPYIDGWMFLDDYDEFKAGLPKPISIYMVSSSIDPRDITRAKNNVNVKDYVVKPVTRERFIELLQHAA